jgi:hypothetical protein
MSDRRAMQRFNLRLSASVCCKAEERGVTPKEECVTTNICAGGAYFLISKPFPIGMEVLLDISWPPPGIKLKKPYKTLINLSGTVVRSDADGMAVVFRNDVKFIGNGP